MSLDVRTIMVLFAMLGLMFAGLLALARLNSGSIRGVRQWAAANVCLAIGLGFAYFFTTRTPATALAVVCGATLVATGIALQFTGIQSFKEEKSYKGAALLFVGLAALQNFWFEFLHPDIYARSIANSLLFSAGYAACARALLIRIEPPLKTAFRLTGLSFAALSAVLLVRAILILQSQPATVGLYANTPVNPASFLVACLLQLSITFGFLLMLNYKLIAEIQKLASRDMLTGAFNRLSLEEEAARLKSRCTRAGETLAIMMIDVDHFKSINDSHGHLAGDEVLRRLARIAQAAIRGEDYFARFGGEEFCILLPACSVAEAHGLAERLRTTYAATIMEISGKTLTSTISIGVADSSQAGMEFRSLVAAADQALYRAKQEGRNRVVSY